MIIWFFISMVNLAFIALTLVSYFAYVNYNVNLNVDGTMS